MGIVTPAKQRRRRSAAPVCQLRSTSANIDPDQVRMWKVTPVCRCG